MIGLRFSEILKLLSDISVSWNMIDDPEIRDVEIHSDFVKEGDIFICRKGERFDSHELIKEVVKKGAVVLICEREPEDLSVPYVVVTDSRIAEAVLVNAIYDRPYEKLLTIGVTGTNGKTSTVHIIHHILRALGLNGGMISTVYNEIVGERFKSPNTTPSAVEIFRMMKKTHELSGNYIVMEVSSHALALKRVYTVRYDSAALLNVTRDHLDFHKTFEAYKRTKFNIFELLKPESIGVINDEFYEDFKSKPFRKVFVGERGFYQVLDVKVSLDGTDFKIKAGDVVRTVHIGAIGYFNAYNTLFALAILNELGFDLDEMIEAVSDFSGVEGRFERIKEAERFGFYVFVDFAHNSDGLEKALKTARSLRQGKGRVILVFGAGGQADKGKRKIMGKVASELADIPIVTDDDPRGEDPEEIIQNILEGFPPDKKPLVLRDRREAIQTALTLASRKDIILIAGRGHEEFQIYDENNVVPFKDADVVREILQKNLVKKR